MGELTEKRVGEILQERLADIVEPRVREIVKEALAAAKPRLKGPPSLFSKRNKKSKAQPKAQPKS